MCCCTRQIHEDSIDNDVDRHLEVCVIHSWIQVEIFQLQCSSIKGDCHALLAVDITID